MRISGSFWSGPHAIAPSACLPLPPPSLLPLRAPCTLSRQSNKLQAQLVELEEERQGMEGELDRLAEANEALRNQSISGLDEHVALQE